MAKNRKPDRECVRLKNQLLAEAKEQRWRVTRNDTSKGGSFYIELHRGQARLKVRISDHPFVPKEEYRDASVEKFSVLVDQISHPLARVLNRLRSDDIAHQVRPQRLSSAPRPADAAPAVVDYEILDVAAPSDAPIAAYVLLGLSKSQLEGTLQAGTQGRAVKLLRTPAATEPALQAAARAVAAGCTPVALFCGIDELCSASFYSCRVAAAARLMGVEVEARALVAAEVLVLASTHRVSELTQLNQAEFVPTGPCAVERPPWM